LSHRSGTIAASWNRKFATPRAGRYLALGTIYPYRLRLRVSGVDGSLFANANPYNERCQRPTATTAEKKIYQRLGSELPNILMWLSLALRIIKIRVKPSI